jgi:hypothetical protein
MEAAASPQGRMGGVLFVTLGAGDNWQLGARLYQDFLRAPAGFPESSESESQKESL